MLLGKFGPYKIDEITEDDLIEYILKNYSKAKNSTINRMVICPLKAVLNANKVSLDMKLFKEERPTTVYATPEHYKKTVEAYSRIPNLRLIIITMTMTGRRISELTNLTRDKVDWEARTMDLGVTKNDDPKIIKLPEWLMEEIRALPKYPNGRLFGYRARQSLYGTMMRLCEQHGVPYMSPHQIGRHTFAMWALKSGKMSLKQIQAAGGWLSLEAMERYIHLIPADEQVQALDIVDGVFREKSGKS